MLLLLLTKLCNYWVSDGKLLWINLCWHFFVIFFSLGAFVGLCVDWTRVILHLFLDVNVVGEFFIWVFGQFHVNSQNFMVVLIGAAIGKCVKQIWKHLSIPQIACVDKVVGVLIVVDVSVEAQVYFKVCMDVSVWIAQYLPWSNFQHAWSPTFLHENHCYLLAC